MKNSFTIPRDTTFIILLSIFSILLMGGCAGSDMLIPKAHRAPLPEPGNSSMSFQSNLLTVSYTYSRTGNQMTISGNTRISGGADSLDVRLLFLDQTGKVIEKNMVYSSGYRTGKAGGSFHKTLTIPPAATGISFNYSSHPRSGRR